MVGAAELAVAVAGDLVLGSPLERIHPVFQLRIAREEQDWIAYLSHRNAAAAVDDGRLPAEMCTVMIPPRYETAVGVDNLIRRDTTPEALGALRPAFMPADKARDALNTYLEQKNPLGKDFTDPAGLAPADEVRSAPRRQATHRHEPV